MTFINPQKAFEDAIKHGALTVNSTDDNFAGNYMYMHTEDGINAFKHIVTRQYIFLKGDL